MLSFKEGGRKIARVKGGEHNKEFIYLHDVADLKDFKADNQIKFLSKDFFKNHKKLKKNDMLKLRDAIDKNEEPDEKNLKELFIEARQDIQKTIRNEIKITDGSIIPLPNKEIVEKIYVSAPSGAGKSTFCGNWLNEFKKMFKDEAIYVFSSIGEDKALDKHDPIRITLDENLLNDPISPEEVADSVCVFDDVDTIRDPKIKNNVCGFRDWLLEQGRHFKIKMLITSHLLMDHSATRCVLNEATMVCFFPKCGSAYHIKRYLTQYAGLERKQIKKILNLPSRFVCLYRTYPMYILYDKGVYLLTNEDDE